jgi:hypothetical protein
MTLMKVTFLAPQAHIKRPSKNGERHTILKTKLRSIMFYIWDHYLTRNAAIKNLTRPKLYLFWFV